MNKYQKELRTKVEQGPSFLERLDEDVRRRKRRRKRAAEEGHNPQNGLGGGLKSVPGEAAAAAPERNRSNGLL